MKNKLYGVCIMNTKILSYIMILLLLRRVRLVKIMRFPFLLLCLTLLLIIPAYANDNYSETGNPDNFYHLGIGFFNSQLTDIDTFTRSVAGKQTPLIADLDNDGINEIIVIDGDTIRLYNNKELDIIDAFSITDEEITNMIAFDIDNDNFTELIIGFAGVTELLHIIQYNGTSFSNESTFDLSGLTHAQNADMMLKCRDVDDCLLVYSDKASDIGASHFIYGVPFNSTDLSPEAIIGQPTGGISDSSSCFSLIKTMQVADYDNDGSDEYIFSVGSSDGSSQLVFNIYYININSSFQIINEMEIASGGGESSVSFPNSCSEESIVKTFTSPMVFDIDGSPSNGLETLIAFMVDADEYKIFSYRADGSFLDDYPEVEDSDGILISNIMLANAFPDTGTVDFCVMGYESTDGIIDLTCASEQTSELIETREYELDITNLYNITDDPTNVDFYNTITHSALHSTETSEGTNLNEVVNSYGVLELDWDSCNIIGDCDLNLIFENPFANAVVLSVDVEEVDREDLLVMTRTNLWYLDDKFSNQPAEITRYSINPCIDSTWKINTSVEIRISTSDPERNLISAKATLYLGDANEQDRNFTIPRASGTTFTFGNFIANKTIGVGTLRMVARDVGQPSENDTIDLTFSVGSNGVEFGDCITDVDIRAIEAVGEFNESATNLQNNALTTGFRTVGALFLMSELLVFIVILFFLNVGIWFHDHSNPIATLGAMLILNLLAIVVGALLQIVPTGIIIIITVVSLIIAGMWLRKVFTGTGAGGAG